MPKSVYKACELDFLIFPYLVVRGCREQGLYQ